jgi:hypothetical protein
MSCPNPHRELLKGTIAKEQSGEAKPRFNGCGILRLAVVNSA